ncbi:MAG: DUF4143 domain-containing protein [Tenericutes bacterium]|nr:DUF4143 domain-containing protein [Mycoplasmatota bacterium]
MSLKKEEYLPRLIDKKIDDYLQIFGAISVEGPKWCGKTWTCESHAKSGVYLDDPNTIGKAKLDLELILNEEQPELIDEWHLVPQVWDRVRRKCDESTLKGKYILTCSTQLNDEKQKEIFHSGAGRIGKINMYTMSLFESKNSTGEASLTDLFNGTQQNKTCDTPSISTLAEYIIRGGWPGNINVKKENAGVIPASYIESILDKDMNDDKKRDKSKMIMLLKSLARNESTIVNNQTIIKDIEMYENKEELIESRITIADYLDVLERLHITINTPPYTLNYRSKERIGKASKRHLVDPSLSCAVLSLTPDKLINDLKTFGFLFEALVERDLRIYIESLGGNIYHFRDNVTGLEVDSILEWSNGEYAAIEIKLGIDKLEEAKETLQRFENNMLKKPKFKCVIVGNADFVARDPETGIYILPITALKP